MRDRLLHKTLVTILVSIVSLSAYSLSHADEASDSTTVESTPSSKVDQPVIAPNIDLHEVAPLPAPVPELIPDPNTDIEIPASTQDHLDSDEATSPSQAANLNTEDNPKQPATPKTKTPKKLVILGSEVPVNSSARLV